MDHDFCELAEILTNMICHQKMLTENESGILPDFYVAYQHFDISYVLIVPWDKHSIWLNDHIYFKHYYGHLF